MAITYPGMLLELVKHFLTHPAFYIYIDDSDGCAGVECPDVTDCPTQPYVPLGECCPICYGRVKV